MLKSGQTLLFLMLNRMSAMLDRKPKIGDKLLYRESEAYTVVGYYNHSDDKILHLQDGKGDITQIIWPFHDGKTNNLLSFA